MRVKIEDLQVGDRFPGGAVVAGIGKYAIYFEAQDSSLPNWIGLATFVRLFGPDVEVEREMPMPEPYETVLGQGIARVLNAPSGWHVGMPVVITPKDYKPPMPEVVRRWLGMYDANPQSVWHSETSALIRFLREQYQEEVSE